MTSQCLCGFWGSDPKSSHLGTSAASALPIQPSRQPIFLDIFKIIVFDAEKTKIKKILSSFKPVESRLDLEKQMYPKTRSLGFVPFAPGSTLKASKKIVL